MSTATFVEQLYQKFLFRGSDEAGKAYWINRLETGQETVAQVTYNFASSEEYTQRAKSVSELYFLLFERVPDSEGMQYWLGQVDQGMSINSLAEAFMNSQEYGNKYGDISDNRTFINQLFENSIGETPTATDEQEFTSVLNNGGRVEVIRSLASNDKFASKHGSEIEKTSLYYGVLGRAPTAQELNEAPESSADLIDYLYSHSDYSGETLPSTILQSKDVVQSNGLTINGTDGVDLFLGKKVSDAGDMNGDGLNDFIVMGGNNAYLVFGDNALATNGLDLSGLDGSNGVKITTDGSFMSITTVGDINGDGFDDVAISDRTTGSSERSFLLFGQGNTWQPVINPFDQGPETAGASTVLLNNSVEIFSPLSISGIGDVNGDGIDDLFVSSDKPLHDQNENGRLNVIYGREGAWESSFNLSTFDNSQGTVIRFSQEEPFADITAHHHGVNRVGDLNKDGIDDLVIPKDQAQASAPASAQVLYGKAGGWDAPVFLDDSTTGETAGIIAATPFRKVDSAGDFNGDGIADALFSLRVSNNDNKVVNVVFGNDNGDSSASSTNSLDGNNGVVITYSGDDGDTSFFTANPLGDVNKDGYSDIVVSRLANANTEQELYIVYGSATASDEAIDLYTLTPQQGVQLQNNHREDGYFNSLSSVGDVNGDGYSDFMMGDHLADLPGVSGVGQAYLIFGGDQLFG